MKLNMFALAAAGIAVRTVHAWEIAYFSDSDCTTYTGSNSGTGNATCDNTGADADSEYVQLTNFANTGCIATLYEGTDCQTDPQFDFESFDEDGLCEQVTFSPFTYDVTGCTS